MLALLGWTAASAALVGSALLIHTRVRGFLPEDAPEPGRKRHPRPTPMVGAVPASITAVALWVAGMPWPALGVALAIAIGLVDDIRKDGGDGVRWTTKAVALAAAVGCAAAGLDIGWAGHSVLLLPTVFLALFVLTNATNFLDNTDGVATSLGVVALAWIGGGDPTSVATWLAGVWLAFLPFNWPRARMFLGDAGALALGLATATLAFDRATTPDGIDPLRAFAPVAVFALDFTQVVTARLWLGYAPWIADRRHLTHVLIARGLSRVWVAPTLVAAALVLAAAVELAIRAGR